MAISGKYELYYATIRNGYYLPSYKSSIVTENYITSVINGELFCPEFKDIRLLPCPFPPDKDTLVTYEKNIKTPSKKPLGIDDFDHLPDKDWLVKLLSTYKPDSRIFTKDYVPPPRVKKIDA